MPDVSYAPAGTLTAILIAALLWFTGILLNEYTRTSINRLSFSGGPGNKPYTPVKPDKPKKPKEKYQLHMARAQMAGTGVTGLSGSIQGTTFLKNNVVRVKRMPNNVRNAATQFVRGLFSGTSTAWKTLTATEVSSWITAAPLYFSKRVFATAYALKGNTLFQRVNNVLTSVGVTSITTAPGIVTPGFVIVSADASGSVAGATLGIVVGEFNGAVVLPALTYMKVYATRQVDVGRSSFSKSQYRYIASFAPGASTNPLDVRADYIAKFGTPAVGQRIGFAVEVVSTIGAPVTEFGLSGKFYTSAVIGA